MGLIDELKDEHAEIERMLQRVVDAGIVTEEARVALTEARDRILMHLARENAELYPALRASAASKQELNRLLKAYGDNIEGILRMALQFFDSCRQRGADKEFARELGKLYAALRERIQREEKVLFRAYEQLTGDPGSAGSK